MSIQQLIMNHFLNRMAPKLILRGLVGYYDITNPSSYSGSGTDWLDLSTLGNDLTNIASLPTAKPLGFDYDGNAHYSTTLPMTNTNNFTFYCFVNMTNTNQGGYVINIGSRSDAYKGYGVGVGNSSLDDNGNDLVGVINGLAWLPSGRAIGTGWHMIGLMRRSGKWYSILDGVVVSLIFSTIPVAPTTDFIIGGGQITSATPRWFDGLVNDVMVHNVALTDGEILQNFYVLKNKYPIGLVAHYDASNIDSYPGSGDIWYDLTENNNDGTLEDSPVFQNTTGGELEFSHISPYPHVEIPDSTELNFGTGDFTISAWVYDKTVWYGAAAAGTIVSKNYTCYEIAVYQGTIVCYVAGVDIQSSSDSIEPNLWYNIVLRRISGNTELFINGASDTTATSQTGSCSNTSSLAIGTRIANKSTSGLNGSVAQVAMYSRGLLTSEILYHFDKDKSKFGL